MWRFGPTAPHENICSTTWFPFLIYPYMTGRWGDNTFIMRPFRPNPYIYLGARAIDTAKYDGHNKQIFSDVFHSSVFPDITKLSCQGSIAEL
jgi:hypothetical protein